MTEWEIWHNPRCSKSRQALRILQENGVEPKVVLYLQAPPSPSRLHAVLNLLGMEPHELIRTKEPVYQSLGLDELWVFNHGLNPLLPREVNLPETIAQSVQPRPAVPDPDRAFGHSRRHLGACVKTPALV